MHFSARTPRFAAVLVTAFCCALPSAAQFPDAPGKEVTVKLCNNCHGPELTTGKGRTRAQWGEVIASMISRGAKGTDQEFAQVLDYLAKNLPPSPVSLTAGPPRRQGPSAGPADVQIVDAVAADRGKTVYIAECITCHGQRARGKDDAPDLVRSVVVLHDRYGSTLGPFLKNGHPLQSGRPSAGLTQLQTGDLAHFLHQRVADTLRSGPYSKVINVLTGDARAGAAYFSGAGQCGSCHSASGDLAGIAAKYDPPTLQQRFLFPRAVSFGRGGRVSSNKPVTVTVTPAAGPPVTGVLDRLDDFSVSLRDESGQYHSFTRTPGMKVEKHDPYSIHADLLEKYTDQNIHDVVAYLATLK